MWGGGRRKEEGGRRRGEAVLTQLKNLGLISAHISSLCPCPFPQQHVELASEKGRWELFAAKFLPEKALPWGRNSAALPRQNCLRWLLVRKTSLPYACDHQP